MPKKVEKVAEALDLLDLAKDYYRMAKSFKNSESLRGRIDMAYHSAELSAKALLLLEMDSLPKTHSRIVQKFGEDYVKKEPTLRVLGRSFRKGLERRNKSRYDPHATLIQSDGEEMVRLAEEMIDLVEKRMESLTNESMI